MEFEEKKQSKDCLNDSQKKKLEIYKKHRLKNIHKMKSIPVFKKH